MKAKEMFEELGYEQSINKKYTLEYRYYTYTDTWRVRFKKNNKKLYINGEITDYKELTNINNDIFKAINKQIEELGWNK